MDAKRRLEVFVASLPNSFTTFPKLISDEDLIGAFDTPGAVVAWLNNGALIAQRVNAVSRVGCPAAAHR